MDEKVLQRRPSDVFLAMVQERAADDSFDYFSQLVETWAQIRELEAIATRERMLEGLRAMESPSSGASRHLPPEGKALWPDEGIRPCEERSVEDAVVKAAAERVAEIVGKSTPESTPGEGEKVHAEGVEKVHGEGVENTPDQTGDPVQNGPSKKRDGADIGRRSLATRKRKVYDGVDRLRAAGISMQAIADAAPGLNISDVLQVVEHKPVLLPTLARLEDAVEKLEG